MRCWHSSQDLSIDGSRSTELSQAASEAQLAALKLFVLSSETMHVQSTQTTPNSDSMQIIPRDHHRYLVTLMNIYVPVKEPSDPSDFDRASKKVCYSLHAHVRPIYVTPSRVRIHIIMSLWHMSLSSLALPIFWRIIVNYTRGSVSNDAMIPTFVCGLCLWKHSRVCYISALNSTKVKSMRQRMACIPSVKLVTPLISQLIR